MPVYNFQLISPKKHLTDHSPEGLFWDNERNNTNENNKIKNFNWREADQLAIHKDDLGVEPGTYPEQHRLVGFEFGSRIDIQHASLP